MAGNHGYGGSTAMGSAAEEIGASKRETVGESRSAVETVLAMVVESVKTLRDCAQCPVGCCWQTPNLKMVFAWCYGKPGGDVAAP